MRFISFLFLGFVCFAPFSLLANNTDFYKEEVKKHLAAKDTLNAIQSMRSLAELQNLEGNFRDGLLNLGKADQLAKQFKSSAERFYANFEIAKAMQSLARIEEAANYQVLSENMLEQASLSREVKLNFYLWSSMFYSEVEMPEQARRAQDAANTIKTAIQAEEEAARAKAEEEKQRQAEAERLAAQEAEVKEAPNFFTENLHYILGGLVALFVFIVVLALASKKKSASETKSKNKEEKANTPSPQSPKPAEKPSAPVQPIENKKVLVPKLDEAKLKAATKNGFNLVLKAYEQGSVFQFLGIKDNFYSLVTAENLFFGTEKSELQNQHAYDTLQAIAAKGDFNPNNYANALAQLQDPVGNYKYAVFVGNKENQQVFFKSNGFSLMVARAGGTEWHETTRQDFKSANFINSEPLSGQLQEQDVLFICNTNFLTIVGKDKIDAIFKENDASNINKIKMALVQEINAKLNNQQTKLDLAATVVVL
ncbi:MAG: hypothetical protein ACXITV_04870 [Luteibaculaceae bacterium]